MKNAFMKNSIIAFALLLIITLLSGCGSNSEKVDVKDVIGDTNNNTEQMIEEMDDIGDVNGDEISDARKKVHEKAEGTQKEENAKQTQAQSSETSKPLSGMTVHFINVGQADAALIQYDNHAILIDAGDWNKDEVVPYLKKQGVKKLDLVIGSHPHADHIGQIDKVFQNFEVDEAWMTGGINTSSVMERTLTAIENSNASYDEPRAGDKYQIGDLKIDVLSPNSITGNLNDDSIVMKLTYGDVSFLFTGDAETPSEKRMVSSGQDLSATVLKAGHHGSDTSTTQPFLDKVNPEVVVISVAEKSKYNHPNKSVIDRLNAKGVDLYATKTHGNIVINTDGQSYSISKDKEGKVTAGGTGEKSSESVPSKGESVSSANNVNPGKQPVKTAETTTGCIDINSASDSELQGIKHVGPATAPKVSSERPFASVDELTKVSGIGPKKIADIKAEGLACVK